MESRNNNNNNNFEISEGSKEFTAPENNKFNKNRIIAEKNKLIDLHTELKKSAEQINNAFDQKLKTTKQSNYIIWQSNLNRQLNSTENEETELLSQMVVFEANLRTKNAKKVKDKSLEKENKNKTPKPKSSKKINPAMKLVKYPIIKVKYLKHQFDDKKQIIKQLKSFSEEITKLQNLINEMNLKSPRRNSSAEINFFSNSPSSNEPSSKEEILHKRNSLS